MVEIAKHPVKFRSFEALLGDFAKVLCEIDDELKVAESLFVDGTHLVENQSR